MSVSRLSFLHAALLACALAAPAAGTAAATAATDPVPAAPPPIADFFDNSAFSDAELSPNGKYLAVRFSNDNKRDRLIVIDLASNAIKVVAQFADRDVDTFQWVNDERLVFDSTDKTIGQGDAIYGPGLFAVNRDGSNFKQLVHVNYTAVQERSVAKNTLPPDHYLVTQTGAQTGDEVYVINPKRDGIDENGDILYVNLLRLNTVTGRAETIKRPGLAQGWLLDHKGEPRLCITVDKQIETIWYLDPANKEWRTLASFDTYVGGKEAFTPLAFGPDGTLYVLSDAGKDKQALHTFDLATRRISAEPLVALADYDFNGRLITSGDKLLGIRYLSDARATVWYDSKMKAAQASIDAALPATANLIDPPAHPGSPWLLVKSYSDKQPQHYTLYNSETGKFTGVGGAHERIVPSRMALQELVRAKARDGLPLPAWLTLPKGHGKNLPMVVLVHGGPYVRGHEWSWSADSQFLASRGYAVLEPEFRGSTGFGTKHYKAGWKQWGLKMQDDIADATKWAIAQGIADPKRICIAGASYGGYATLMGLVNDPALYKCGINWVGVTDIELLYSGHWSFTSDLSSSYIKYGAPTLIGDPVKDAAQLRATSPLLQAARITQPLLMAYGAADRRVPLYHGKKFLDAVKANNPNVEWVVYQEEGHGWSLPKNRIDFWGRVEKFLGRHIGTP